MMRRVTRRGALQAAAIAAAALGFGSAAKAFAPVADPEPEDVELLTWLQEERAKSRARVDQLRAELHDELPRETFRKVWSLAFALANETAASNAYLCVAGVPCGSQGLQIGVL
jgi:hypothetical protein